MAATAIREKTLCSTIFTPAVGAVVVFSARNCAGNALSDAPAVVGVGQFRTFCPEALVDKQVSITKHATNAAGVNRLVTVVLSLLGGVTQIDIFIKNDAANPTNDALFVEVTIGRLPL